MKKLYAGFLAACICVAAIDADAQEKPKYSQIKINVKKSNVAALQESGIDLDHAFYNEEEETITTTVDDKEIKKLKNAGVKFQVTVDDEEEDFLRRNNPREFFKYDNSRSTANQTGRLLFNTPDKSVLNTIVTPAAFNPGSMGGYLTFAEMKRELDSMVMNYPGLVRLDSIGRTYENRAIWAVTISGNVSTGLIKSQVLYTGMHHAREPLAMTNLIFFMQYLLENYSTDNRIKEIVDQREMVFIPCLNPDGYVYNQTTNPNGGGLWRKNRQPNSDRSLGQDLNRNYGFGFDYPNNGSSDVTTDQTYHGDSAFSAMETQLIKQYLRTKNFKFALNYHAYGGYWINGYCVPTGTLTATDQTIINTTRAIATRHNIYKVGTPLETVGYNANGTSDDWFMGGDVGIRQPVYAISPEVGLGLTTFWPAASTIIGYCKDVLYSNLQTALYAGSYVDVDDRSSMALTTLTGTFNFVVRRVGGDDLAVTITVLPLENISTVGAPVLISTLPNYLTAATASISYTLPNTITSGRRVRFVVKTETGGITMLDTVTKFFNPVVLLQDDMETGTMGKTGAKWTSSTWNYSTASANSGTRSLTESPSGTYTASSTRTINTTATFNLSDATFAYLSFWTRYRSQNGHDKLQVKVSTNGTTYTALPGVHTIAESKGTLAGVPSLTGYQDYWVREIIDLKSVTGTGATSVRVRFEFTSDGSINDDGFYIDDVQLIKSTVQATSARTTGITVQATKADNEVLIGWESAVNSDHHYFEVERSIDGENFSTIYKTTDRTQRQFTTDHSPANGVNYYRIKAVGRTSVQYSERATVIFNNDRLVKLYPNPVREEMQLELTGLAAGKYQLQVINFAGQVINYKQVELGHQFTKLTMNTSGIAPGKYQLCIRKANGEIVDVKAFVKL